MLADQFKGRRLNSPNDVVVRRDGSIWFTDPEFGILGYYEGTQAAPELPTHVYRLRPGHRRADGGGRRYRAAERHLLFAR